MSMLDSIREELKERIDIMPLRACVESFDRLCRQKDNAAASALNIIENLTTDNKMLAEMLLMYGDHTSECAYIEEAASGRMLADSESEICDCGWIKAKKMLEVRLEKE